MGNMLEEHANDLNNAKNVLIGLLIGGLAGAAAVLLFAPQSGKRTRAQIQQKSTQWRDQTSEGIKHALAQVRSGTHEISSDVREKAGQLKQLGQDKLVKQLDRVSADVDAMKTAVEAA